MMRNLVIGCIANDRRFYELGYRVPIIPDNPGSAGLADAVEAYFSRAEATVT
jgi:hypothetical protein